MKNIIIGTAGHVDHGKTQLIKALSGIDTDRLEEEKKRGITIELGFAHIPNDAGYNIGVIDVPGHEKFIKNMLAGIGGIDFVVFVVAADEGIMPQTREHFEILQSLGIDDGIIAVTKTDMVDEEWLEMLLEEVEDYFKGSFLEGKPVVPVSARTGDNIEVLKEEIIKKCDRENKRREERELFRLPIDRVFTMSGFGTVVTGTLLDGIVSVGDELQVQPKGLKVKVRGIQTYGKDTDSAIAGQRTAINLSGVKKEDIDRGDVLSADKAVSVTNMLDVKLKVFSSTDRIILNNSRVHVYAGAKEALAKVIILDRESLAAGEEAYVQLRLEEPMAVRRGDRFIVRFYSPIITVGGGVVLDALPDKHKRNKEAVLNGLSVMESGSLEDLAELKAGGRQFVKQDELTSELGLLDSEMDAVVKKLLADNRLIKLRDGSLLSGVKFGRLRTDLEFMINTYHEANPLADGIPKQELLSRLRGNWHIEDEKLLQALVAYLMEQGVLEDRGKSLALAGFKVEYSEEQLAIKDKIKAEYEAVGIELSKSDEVLAKLDCDKALFNNMLAELVEEGSVVKLDAGIYAASEAFAQAVAAARSFGAPFTLAEFRDKLGTSRKYAELWLAALDRNRVTQFNGGTRTVL
ncbi:MAG: selenocysteine-specific translation elongation factor [Clostridiales bacterium]|nr:selenocysteine-specific translation elongation factor [Candidatus Crickella caballi]